MQQTSHLKTQDCASRTELFGKYKAEGEWLIFSIGFSEAGKKSSRGVSQTEEAAKAFQPLKIFKRSKPALVRVGNPP